MMNWTPPTDGEWTYDEIKADLINAACEAEEIYSDDELQRYANEWREKNVEFVLCE